MDSVFKKKKNVKEVCEVKSPLGQHTNGSVPCLQGTGGKMRYLAGVCSSTAGSPSPPPPSLALSDSSCSVYSLGFLFSTWSKIEKQKKRKVSWYVFQLLSFPLCVWFPLAMILFPTTCSFPGFSCLPQLGHFLVFCHPGLVWGYPRRAGEEAHRDSTGRELAKGLTGLHGAIPSACPGAGSVPVVGSSLGLALGVHVTRSGREGSCSKGSLSEKGIRIPFFHLLRLVWWEGKCRPEPTKGLLGDRANHGNN